MAIILQDHLDGDRDAVMAERVCRLWAGLLARARLKRRRFRGARFIGWAAGADNLIVVEWARAQGCPWDAETCAEAARGGHLHVLAWLRDKGCPWDESTCTKAARGGHVDVIKWARANGCPCDMKSCACAAAVGGHIHMLAWVHATGGRARRRLLLRQRCIGRACRCHPVAARKRLRLECLDVRHRRQGGLPTVAQMAARQRLPVGRVDMPVCGISRRSRHAPMGARPRLSVGPPHVHRSG
ncbi:Ankyrin repeat domain containing protein [Pandoravirus salinus]|uniref:Ankyrin repeat domain containing protein n=1 Tax=Pandoravirus salinus TaxID=1349410 RepID=A0A291ATK8_9VIRU|nr:ankyrin repeat domain [Pandoravirus salinus]ATE82231.1 Ankyrin repeat domain containing protein [Pandoravirus salinus]